MRYLWTEDTGAGFHFWKLVNQLFFDNELVVESKGSNQGLLDAVLDIDIKDDDSYYVAFDYVVDNQDIRNKYRILKSIADKAEGKIIILDMICFEYLILAFDKLVEWTGTGKTDKIKIREEVLTAVENHRINISKIDDEKTLQYIAGFKRYSTERVMKSLVGEFTQNEKWSVKGTLMGECWYKDCCVSEHPDSLRCGKFNELGYRTVALSGEDSEMVRQDAFERLAMDETNAAADKTPIDYIFSVDVLNEGVDIVEVNQVIMLRPTQSPIVFIQQLGRGLRKAEAKEYVVILDFIGNYNNNFMIPIALSGDRTYNKDNIRRYVMEGERMIPGASTVHFDEVSRKRIFASVDNANFSDIRLIKENYTNLKNKLGRIPRLRDFDEYGEMDVIRIFDNNSLGSYYKFLVKYEKEYKTRLPEDEEKVIEFVSKKLANGKRIQELQMLKRILTYARGLAKFGLFAGLSEDMRKYGKDVSQDQKENIVNVMYRISLKRRKEGFM